MLCFFCSLTLLFLPQCTLNVHYFAAKLFAYVENIRRTMLPTLDKLPRARKLLQINCLSMLCCGQLFWLPKFTTDENANILWALHIFWFAISCFIWASLLNWIYNPTIASVQMSLSLLETASAQTNSAEYRRFIRIHNKLKFSRKVFCSVFYSLALSGLLFACIPLFFANATFFIFFQMISANGSGLVSLGDYFSRRASRVAPKQSEIVSSQGASGLTSAEKE